MRTPLRVTSLALPSLCCWQGWFTSVRYITSQNAEGYISMPPSSPAAISLLEFLRQRVPASTAAAQPITSISRDIPEELVDSLDVGLKDFLSDHPNEFVVTRESSSSRGATWVVRKRGEVDATPPTSPSKVTIVQDLLRDVPPAPVPPPSVAACHVAHSPQPQPQSQPHLVPPPMELRLSASERMRCRHLLRDQIPLQMIPLSALAARRNESEQHIIDRLFGACPPECVNFVDLGPEDRYVQLSPLFAEVLSCSPSIALDYYVQQNVVVEEFDAFRLARFLSVTDFIDLQSLEQTCGDVLTKRLRHVLLSYPHLFAFETMEMKRVRFILRDHYIPAEVTQMAPDALRSEMENQNIIRRACAPSENQERVVAIQRMRHMKRCLAIQSNPLPQIDPDVLAYHVFDVLGQDPITTGDIPTLLPEDVQLVTDARNKKFLCKYPHLFFVFEAPPLYMVQRADLPRPEVLGANMSVDEIIMSVVAIIEERKIAKKKKGQKKFILPSHIHKYLPEAVKKRIRTSFGSIEKLITSYEGEHFVIDRTAHQTEFAVDVVEKPPSPQQ